MAHRTALNDYRSRNHKYDPLRNRAHVADSRIDAAFNVAGLSGRSLADGPLHECSTAAWQTTTIAAAGYYAPHRIRLNVIAPSLVRTPMRLRAQSNRAIVEFMKRKHPVKGDLIEADEVARIAYFLLTDESFPITGEVVRVDAGWAVTG